MDGRSNLKILLLRESFSQTERERVTFDSITVMKFKTFARVRHTELKIFYFLTPRSKRGSKGKKKCLER